MMHTLEDILLVQKKKKATLLQKYFKDDLPACSRVIARKDEDYGWKNIQFVHEEVIRTSLVSTISV